MSIHRLPRRLLKNPYLLLIVNYEKDESSYPAVSEVRPFEGLAITVKIVRVLGYLSQSLHLHLQRGSVSQPR